MFKKMTKKDMYEEGLIIPTYINNELAIKPYYYYRNGLLHVRYTVDRCIHLSASEAERLKADMTSHPERKQEILERAWSFFEKTVRKSLIMDGITEAAQLKIEEHKKNGWTH